MKKIIRSKVFRKELYSHFIEVGGTPKQWGQLLKSQLPPEIYEQALQWDLEESKAFVADQARQWQVMSPVSPVPDSVSLEAAPVQSAEMEEPLSEPVGLDGSPSDA
ncbi:MAG: hypothetical protein A3H27_00525 [Acidobacteria bacterium RIFCSPLOWO2_02_FULL_59_13]|nr:MAG: hypothetical protein A3H27_00525 [Acidobacteria bacterium RIFCSPLOWO2_02_FULL_59_13]